MGFSPKQIIKDTSFMKVFIQMKPSIYSTLMFAAAVLLLIGCRMSYSFTGASISPEVKSVCIKDFPNHAPLYQPILSQTFTEALKDKFQSQTRLQLVTGDGDLTIEGEIIGYGTQPLAIQMNENAALNRVTVTIHVKFTNNKDPKQNFDTNFARYADYESSKSLNDVEGDLIKTIVDQINDDIFNKAVANW